MPTVYGVSPSPFVRKVLVALAEKDIDYDHEIVSPFDKKPEYLKISPLGKVPAFRDGDTTFSDSSVILAYLEKTRPEKPLYPEDPADYARALWLEEYADTKFGEVIATAFFNRVVKVKLMGGESDEVAVKAALEEELPGCLDYLEGQIANREFFVADRFTTADLSVATMLVQLRYAGEKVDEARWPKLAAWFERVVARPSFQGCLEQDKAMLGG